MSAAYTERSLPAIAAKIRELMSGGMTYDAALIEACRAIPPEPAKAEPAESRTT